MPRRALLALSASFAIAAATPALADCYDVSKGEPQALEGVLDHVVFPGPPNYKDIEGGDAPEPAYVLRLPDPICLKGDDFADPSKPFKAVQLFESEANAGQLEHLLNRKVRVRLKGPLAAQNGHHHEPLVAWVVAIEATDEPPAAVENDTAAATVRSFYHALGDGHGDIAALLIAPERRAVPAFSAAAMTSFYGGLKEPLRLESLERSGQNAYLVAYRYAAGASECQGRALVVTRAIDGASYIDSIKALNGC